MVIGPLGCHLRPAQRRDCRAIRRLTRQLLPDRWQGYKMLSKLIVGVVVGLLVSLFVSLMRVYGGLFWQWVVAMLPLGVVAWGIVLLALWDGLPWDRYWVLDRAGQVVGCGRVEDYGTHGELYDLVIDKSLRRGGLGQFLVLQLAEKCRRPLYLASLPAAIGFYQGLGFVPVDEVELMPLVQSRLSLTNPRFRQMGLQAMVLR
jgi:N-acetylglutamate synthase-like GNAT family acetyltransferase